MTLLLAALLGGIVATMLSPTTVRTEYYAADVRLAPSWSDRSSIQVDTVVGGLTARFAGIAPGVDVEPRVRPEIADVVADGRVSTSALVVGEAERARVIRDAVEGVALRFVLGSAAAATLVVGALALWRRSPPRPATVVAAVLAWALTCAGVGLAAERAYRTERFVAIQSTGLLELAQANGGLLADVEARAGQATPYLRNLLALSAALSSEYTPTELDSTPAVTVLLVSDIHAANHYALLRTVVEERDVDVVVDTGDLINLGRVEEARLSRLSRGIASLGVPYVFVRGNHDASSATDTALLDELAGVEGVHLLDTVDGYTEIDVGGIRVSGFNDPRWYGDSDDGDLEPQHEARERWMAALGEATPPDITISHEAPALDGAPGRVRVHGHGHVPGIDGNRVAVGTFTGGGTLKHFVATGPDAELAGQPSAFDLLIFGPDCQAQTLTRYEYRSVIEGRPSYDRLAVVNAARVVEPAEEGRTCGGSPVVTRPLGQAP